MEALARETMPPADETPVAMRLPTDLVERADALISVMATAPEYKLFRMSRSAVLRVALSMGLDALEQRFGKPEPAQQEPRPPGSRGPRPKK